jgi:hypothetical protein
MKQIPEGVSILVVVPKMADRLELRKAAIARARTEYPKRKLTGRLLYCEQTGQHEVNGKVKAEYECVLEVEP